MNLTHNDVKSILEIVDHAEHLDEIELVFAGLKLHVRRSGGELPARAVGVVARATAAAEPTASPSAPAKLPATTPMELAPQEVAVRAPMLGTFYHAPSPGEKPFVEVGQRVKADDTVGVIEVMKLFNSIRAGVDGVVVRVEAPNAALVEYDQRLIIIAQD